VGATLKAVVELHAYLFGDGAHEVAQRDLLAAGKMAGTSEAERRPTGKNGRKVLFAVHPIG
jgi:hypothetical protein